VGIDPHDRLPGRRRAPLDLVRGVELRENDPDAVLDLVSARCARNIVGC